MLLPVIHLDSGSSGGSGVGYIGVFNNYTALTTAFPTAPTLSLAYVQNSQGTPWLPGSLLGTFYSKGTYLFDGVSWVDGLDEVSEELQNILDTMNTQDLESVLTQGNTTGAFDISLDTSQVVKATTGSSVLQLKQSDTFIQDGSFGVDDVSLLSLSPIASCLALLKSTFAKVGQFCVYNNDAADVNTGGFVNYPCASAAQNWIIKQSVTNVLTSSGKDGIAKTDDSIYCNQLAYNTGLSGELIVNHSPSVTDYTQTHQDDDGIIALTKNIPKAFFSVNLDSAESSISRVFAGGRTTFTATHNLNTLDLKPEVFRLSDGRNLGWRVERTGVNTVDVSRNGNITDGLFRILI